MKILDPAFLKEHSECEVKLPGASELAGEEIAVRIRRISRVEWLGLLPLLPPEAVEWPADKLAEAEIEWLSKIEPAARIARTAALMDARYMIVARAVIEPPLSVDDVKRLGEDSMVLFTEIMVFSGIFAQRNGAGAPAAEEGTAPAS